VNNGSGNENNGIGIMVAYVVVAATINEGVKRKKKKSNGDEQAIANKAVISVTRRNGGSICVKIL